MSLFKVFVLALVSGIICFMCIFNSFKDVNVKLTSTQSSAIDNIYNSK